MKTPVAVERVQIIEQVLQSLEYTNSKKVEGDIIERLHERFDVPRALTLPMAARAFAAKTSAEDFLGEVLRLLGPYAAMLRDIYRLLEKARATESGTAEKLRLDDRGMRKACRDMPISEAFLRRLRETYVGWRERDLLDVNWDALRTLVRWDARFYGKIDDVPLLQMLTFAAALIARLRQRPDLTDWREKLEGQLADLSRHIEVIAQTNERVANESTLADPVVDGDALAFPMSEDMNRGAQREYSIAVDDLPGLPPYARLTFTLSQARSGTSPESVDRSGRSTSSTDNNVGGLLFLLTVLRGGIARPWPDAASRNAELRPQLERAIADPSWLHDLVDRLLAELKSVARAVGTLRDQALLERVLEVIDLPFWKDRARLYEVWVLVRTARAVEASGALRAIPRLERDDDTRVLRLPTSAGRKPIFDVEVTGVSARPACLLWFQRRTKDVRRRFHSYEPDVRCTRVTEPYHDLFLVECKDRAGLARRRDGEGFDEVARRYIALSDAELVWLVNYSSFGEPASMIEHSDGRVARFAHHFHPGNTPSEFDETIDACLAWRLAPLLVIRPSATAPNAPIQTADGAESDPAGLVSPHARARVELRWEATPSDLDLHLWCETWSQVIDFRHRGSVEREPWAALSDDRTSGFGPEEIRVTQLAPVRYVVAVHNFSAERPLAGCAAQLTLELEGNLVTVRVPMQGDGRWWDVLAIDGKNGVVTVINRIRASSPWGTI